MGTGTQTCREEVVRLIDMSGRFEQHYYIAIELKLHSFRFRCRQVLDMANS